MWAKSHLHRPIDRQVFSSGRDSISSSWSWWELSPQRAVRSARRIIKWNSIAVVVCYWTWHTLIQFTESKWTIQDAHRWTWKCYWPSHHHIAGNLYSTTTPFSSIIPLGDNTNISLKRRVNGFCSVRWMIRVCSFSTNSRQLKAN